MTKKKEPKLEEGKRYLIRNKWNYPYPTVDVLVLELALLGSHGNFVKLQFPGATEWVDWNLDKWEILAPLSSPKKEGMNA